MSKTHHKMNRWNRAFQYLPAKNVCKIAKCRRVSSKINGFGPGQKFTVTNWKIHRDKLKTHRDKFKIHRDKIKVHRDKLKIHRDKLKIHRDKLNIHRDKIQIHRDKNKIHGDK